MTTYKGINGFGIQYLDSDPANPNIGEVWYNSTTKALKGHGILGAGTWSSGGNLTTARYGLGGAGTQTAGLAFGAGGSALKYFISIPFMFLYVVILICHY